MSASPNLHPHDSSFLHDLIVRVLEARRKHPKPSMHALLEEAAELQEAIECNHGAERARDEALDVACVAMRIAVEIISTHNNKTHINHGIPTS